jgi:hypothetical protein
MMNFYGMFWVKSNLMIYTIQNLYLCWKMMQITIVFIIKFVIFILFITAFFWLGHFFYRDCIYIILSENNQ